MSVINIPEPTQAHVNSWRDLFKIGMVLFKVRVVSLLVMAAIGGAFLGAKGWPGWSHFGLISLTGTLAAMGASALNQYIERERDKQMTRTSKRPLPAGTIDSWWVPLTGVGLVALPVLVMLPFNPALSFFLLLGAVIYVGIYTIWLKPRTLLNIVIGGAAGSAAVMAGGAAVGAWQDPAVIVLALMLFLWTPSHFWSLAILYREDYARADVPMLPTQMSERNAAWWVLSHTAPTAIAALLLAIVPALGWLYFVPVLIFSVDMVRRNIQLIRKPTKKNARAFFMSTNYYLMVVLLAICVDTVWRSLG